jgi:aryl-alcohol dehydrogenase-like predicted oxidoreductase
MTHRQLGPNGPMVGPIGLGCMGFTWAYTDRPVDEADAVAVFARAIELGGTLFDTADVYGPFTNETLVGRALAGRWHDVTVATKCGLVVTDPAAYKIEPDGRPDHIIAACDASLARLGVDVIDLYQLHRVDPKVPLADSWGAMASLVTAGKVRAIGLSEVSVAQCAQAHAIHPVASVQSEMSLWTRSNVPVSQWCASVGAAFLPFSPLGRGFLTGAFPAGTTFASDDFRSRNPRFTPAAISANQTIVDAVSAVSSAVGATNAQVALAWLLAQGSHVIPIPGTKRVSYLEDNLGAVAVTLSAEHLAALDALPDATGSRY